MELAGQGRWLDDRVELPLELVLGPLLSHPSAKWIGFELDGGAIHSSRSKLRATRMALRPFQNVTAHLDHRGLHFRWRGQQGGLDYYPGRLDWREKQSVLLVPLARPVVIERAPTARPPAPPRARAPAPSPRRPPRARPSGA